MLSLNVQDRLLYIGATPPRTEQKVLREWNANMRIEQVRSGHYVMLMVPDECNQFIADFLMF